MENVTNEARTQEQTEGLFSRAGDSMPEDITEPGLVDEPEPEPPSQAQKKAPVKALIASLVGVIVILAGLVAWMAVRGRPETAEIVTHGGSGESMPNAAIDASEEATSEDMPENITEAVTEPPATIAPATTTTTTRSTVPWFLFEEDDYGNQAITTTTTRPTTSTTTRTTTTTTAKFQIESARFTRDRLNMKVTNHNGQWLDAFVDNNPAIAITPTAFPTREKGPSYVFQFESSNTSVATVRSQDTLKSTDKGYYYPLLIYVSAKSPGTCTITVWLRDNPAIRDTIQVTVTEKTGY